MLAPSNVSGTAGQLSEGFIRVTTNVQGWPATRAKINLSMQPETGLVIQLQSLDQQIAALDKEVAALPKHIAVIEKTLESHVRKLEADRAALAANQKERKRLEGDIQVHQQKISKLRDQMLGSK